MKLQIEISEYEKDGKFNFSVGTVSVPADKINPFPTFSCADAVIVKENTKTNARTVAIIFFIL